MGETPGRTTTTTTTTTKAVRAEVKEDAEAPLDDVSSRTPVRASMSETWVRVGETRR